MLPPEFNVERIETTYADLRPTDRIVAKDGTVWPIAELEYHLGLDVQRFWLCDPVTKVKTHFMAKELADPVTVERIPTHAEDVAKAEAEFPGPVPSSDAPDEVFDEWNRTEAEFPGKPLAEAVEEVTGEKGVEVVREIIDGVVTAEVTAEEIDAARQAVATDTPVEIIPFAEMTPLEQRSHLYLLHGVFSNDFQSRSDLVATHDQAHADHTAGKLNARQIPHTHGGVS
jgi:hypothetical protein